MWRRHVVTPGAPTDLTAYRKAMDYAMDFAAQAQRWHETDHGTKRGKPIKATRFIRPRADDVPESVPDNFRRCSLCRPSAPDWANAPHTNPFWFRVTAWESSD